MNRCYCLVKHFDNLATSSILLESRNVFACLEQQMGLHLTYVYTFIKHILDIKRTKIKSHITTAYHVIKTGQPFASFPRAIELQQKNGVDLGTSYHTDEMPWKLLLASRDQVSVSARQSCAEMAVSREESTSCLRLKVGLV